MGGEPRPAAGKSSGGPADGVEGAALVHVEEHAGGAVRLENGVHFRNPHAADDPTPGFVRCALESGIAIVLVQEQEPALGACALLEAGLAASANQSADLPACTLAARWHVAAALVSLVVFAKATKAQDNAPAQK